MKGGLDPDLDALPVGSRADDTGDPEEQNEPDVAELDLPGPDDPVAWNYVESEALIVGPAGEELGRVAAMLGTETEGIFHGIAVIPYRDGTTRVVPADAVTRLTTSRVEIAYDEDELAAAAEFRPVPA
jgi:hypothetical protein